MARPFVTVVTVSSTLMLVEGVAAANPPAPSSVPDPTSLMPNPSSQTPHRLRRHDGGCFAYTNQGPVARAECVKALEHPGEEIEREPTSGECVLLEPWKDEPKTVPCPAVLVPAGYRPASAAAPPPVQMAGPASPASSCARCSSSSPRSSDGTLPIIVAAAIAAVHTRRRGRR